MRTLSTQVGTKRHEVSAIKGRRPTPTMDNKNKYLGAPSINTFFA
jgi:hypothetical protein